MFSAEPSRLGSWNAKKEKDLENPLWRQKSGLMAFCQTKKVKCPSALAPGRQTSEFVLGWRLARTGFVWGLECIHLIFVNLCVLSWVLLCPQVLNTLHNYNNPDYLLKKSLKENFYRVWTFFPIVFRISTYVTVEMAVLPSELRITGGAESWVPGNDRGRGDKKLPWESHGSEVLWVTREKASSGIQKGTQSWRKGHESHPFIERNKNHTHEWGFPGEHISKEKGGGPHPEDMRGRFPEPVLRRKNTLIITF